VTSDFTGDTGGEIRRLERCLARERAARVEAEAKAEAGTRRLFEQQRRLELLQLIATAANAMEDPEEAYRFATERICEHTGLTTGHVWVIDETDSEPALVSAGIWISSLPSDTAFRQQTQTLRLSRGEGLPGRVLADGCAHWTPDLTLEPDWPRSASARASGVRAGFAFPALIGDEIVAVLEFFQSRPAPPDEALLETLHRIGAILGRVVERRRAILRLKRNHELAAERDAAELASSAKSAFLAATSHEVRTPLNAVIGLAEALARESLTPYQRDLNDGILEAGQMLLRLLNAVLDMSRIEAGQAEVVLKDFDLGDTLRSVTSIWKARTRELGIALDLETSGIEPMRIRSDQGRIEQTLINLVSNAVKFTPPRAAILIRAMLTDSHARLEVIDGGCGVPEADRARIFQPFEQTDAGRSAGGAGLGLSICSGNVKLLGGKIGCDSDDLGRSRFWFTFPVMTCLQDAGTPTAEPATADIAGLRVLAAEDNIGNQRVLRALLGASGVALTFAGNGEEALAALRTGRFDVILMDAVMPLMDGVEAVRRIRTEGLDSGAPIHMLTANVFKEDVERYLAAGADGILTKPIEVPALFGVLGAARSQGRPSRAGRYNA
jgi:signal transduction histidine kinase